jgi:uncharacterized RDD family membrane protein YckC
MSDLVTGEAVPLEMRLAKLPSRALAIIIDLLILFVAALVVFSIASRLMSNLDQAAGAAVSIAALAILVIGVPTTIETLSRGRSVGKLALGLRVVRDDGGPVRFRHALLRALAGFFADFFTTAGAGAIICSLLNERGKRIGDWMAGTVVVRERVPTVHTPLPAAPPELAQWATTLELSRLPDDLAMAARAFLARGRELSPVVRDQMGSRLATEVSRVVSPPPPDGVPAWAYLAAVLTERGRRESARLTAERPTPRPTGQESSTNGGTPVALPDTSTSRVSPPDQPSGRNFTPPA